MPEKSPAAKGKRHGTTLAAALSAGRARRHRPVTLPVAGGDVRGRLPSACQQGCLRLHGQDLDLYRARPGLARLRRLAAEQGPATRRPRRHHDAERAAISGGDRRHPARRPDGGERQSAVQAARAGIPAQGFRRRGHHRAGEFRLGAARGAAAHRREAGGGRQHGRHARHRERHAGQSGGAARQEDGAGLHAAGRDQCSTMR